VTGVTTDKARRAVPLQQQSVLFYQCSVTIFRGWLIAEIYKKAVLSQRWPRNAPTKVNKQPHLHLRSR